MFFVHLKSSLYWYHIPKQKTKCNKAVYFLYLPYIFIPFIKKEEKKKNTTKQIQKQTNKKTHIIVTVRAKQML